jgi:hypothetical protein
MVLTLWLKDAQWLCWNEKKKRPNLYVKNAPHWQRHTEKVKGYKVIYQASGSQKQARLAILISDKVDFKPKLEELKLSIF